MFGNARRGVSNPREDDTVIKIRCEHTLIGIL